VTAGFDDGSAKVWDAATGQVIRNLYSGTSETSVRSADWSPDGTRIATCGVGGGRVWDATGGEKLATFDCEAFIDWSQAGDRILGGDPAGIITVWDAATGSELVRHDVGSPVCVAWSPDGRRIAATSLDNALMVLPGWQTTQELIDYAKECCVVRKLTDAEREQFGLGSH
jgi:WD40 repeat protein